MSKSLNQAFIKAYSKEKTRALAQPSLAESSVASPKVYGNDDLIVRFDTATCGTIPAPHLKPVNKEIVNKPKEAVAAAVVSPRSTATVTARPAATGRPARSQVVHMPTPQASVRQLPELRVSGELDGGLKEANNALRSAIAAQMSRAGDWDGSKIEPLLDGKPAHSIDQVQHIAPAERRVASTPQQPTISNAGEERSTRRGASNHIELDSPKLRSPALLSQENSGPGEFFRLDRPSYIPPPAPLADDPFGDSGEMSSEILGVSSSRVSLETQTHTPAAPLPQESSQAARVEQTQSVERELRRSKLRIFNPVWEVDSFQWPDICLELLEQRADCLDTVARNLNDAVQEGLQVLAVTSPQGGEGRTTVACCLAKLAGSRGLNVAIVDGDIENPTLSYQTNLDVEQDWKTAILNQLPLEEIAVHSIDDQVTLVPLIGPIDPSEMAAGDNRIEFMLHELSSSFDLVIVDMGHMSSPRSLINSLGARGVISAVVAVVDHRCADVSQIEHCLRRIRQSGVASIGVVENFAA